MWKPKNEIQAMLVGAAGGFGFVAATVDNLVKYIGGPGGIWFVIIPIVTGVTAFHFYREERDNGD